VPRGVQEDPEGLARLHLVPAGADCDHGGLPGVEVVDLEVEVDLLRVLGPWPARRPVVRDALEGERRAARGRELHPVGVGPLDGGAENRRVEGGECGGIGAVERDDLQAGDPGGSGHGADRSDGHRQNGAVTGLTAGPACSLTGHRLLARADEALAAGEAAHAGEADLDAAELEEVLEDGTGEAGARQRAEVPPVH
jgi:hypothetical protein